MDYAIWGDYAVVRTRSDAARGSRGQNPNDAGPAPDEHCGCPLRDYDEAEARAAYERVAEFHDWSTAARKK